MHFASELVSNTTKTSQIDPDNFFDHGIIGIGGLQATIQALVDRTFPVPPSFP